jgi:hypothetical protein
MLHTIAGDNVLHYLINTSVPQTHLSALRSLKLSAQKAQESSDKLLLNFTCWNSQFLKMAAESKMAENFHFALNPT